MFKKFENQKQILVKGSFLFLTISVPFWMLLNNIAIIFAIIVALSVSDFKRNFRSYIRNKISLLFFILYFLMGLSLLYSNNISYGLKILERTSMFLLLPIILSVFKEFLTHDLLKKALRLFLFSTFIACIICLSFACFRTVEYGAVNPYDSSNGNFFSYFKLTSPLNTHPIYFGVNIVMCLIILLNEFLKREKIINNKSLIFLFVFYLAFLPLLNSFILIISLFFVFLLFFIQIIKKNKITFIQVVLFLSVTTLPIYASTYFLSEKFKGINFSQDINNRDFSGDKFTSLKARHAKAICSIRLISDNLYTGVGIGDGNDKLIQYYKINNFQHGAIRKFNSHNQFLTTSIYIGIIGLVLLMAIFIFLFYEAVQNNNFLCYSFLATMFLFFLTESVLERQKGIFIFLFFVSLLPLYELNPVRKKFNLKQ